MLQFTVYCCDIHHAQKELGEEVVCVASRLEVIIKISQGRSSSRELEAGTCQKRWRKAACWLALDALLYNTGWLPRDGTTYRRLVPSTPIINQENAHGFVYWQMCRGISQLRFLLPWLLQFMLTENEPTRDVREEERDQLQKTLGG